AALEHGDGIVVNAGSGSSVTGRRAEHIERAGGWGHILGDAGGGYFLCIQALRLILREHDLHRPELEFTAKILHALALNNFDELVRWVQTADKMEIAMLAPVVFEAAAGGDARTIEIIEKMNPQTLVQLFIEEEKSVQDALRTAAADLARAIEIVTESLRSGGRLFYIGAGSSGRIGVLDASEIPPTFGAPTHLVQGVIAGGITALHRSVEGAEDEQSTG